MMTALVTNEKWPLQFPWYWTWGVNYLSGRGVFWTVGPGQLKRALLQNEAKPVPTQDAWRVPFLRRLLEERLQHFYMGDKLQESRIQGLIDSLVVN